MDGGPFATNKPISLRMHQAVDLTTTFVDVHGKPVADIPVSLRVFAFNQQVGELRFIVFPVTKTPPFSGRTGSDGAITFLGLPQSCHLQFAMNDDRFAPLVYSDSIQLPADAKFSAGPIQLHTAGSISGKVIFGATGKPAAGVSVGAQTEQAGSGATTAADGSYRITRLGQGKYNIALVLSPDQEKNWTAVAIEGLSLAEGENKQGIDLSMVAGGLISGKVLAKEDGHPIAGVQIGVFGPASPMSGLSPKRATSGADGSFSLRVPEGEQDIYVLDSKFLQEEVRQTVTVTDGQTTKVDFRIAAPASTLVTGKVVGPDGAPVPHAQIAVESRSQAPSPIHIGVESNEAGLFQVQEGVNAEGARLRARSGDLATRAAVNVMPNSKDVVIHLEKNVLSSITGRVVDGNGNPQSDIQISLTVMGDRYGSSQLVGLSDDKGQYRIDNLYPDIKCNVEAQGDGYGHAATKQIRLKPGAVVKVKDLVLRKRDTFIAGTVIGDDGNPVAGLKLTLRSQLSGVLIVNTDTEGKFHVAVVAGDKVSILYQIKGHQLMSKTVMAGDQDIMIDPLAETAK